jgi:hypothetical protein
VLDADTGEVLRPRLAEVDPSRRAVAPDARADRLMGGT